MDGRSLPRAFERTKFFVAGGAGNFTKNLRDVFKMPCKRAALSTGVPLGNLVGIRLLASLRETENAYLSTFSWTQKTLKVKSVAHLEFEQGTGLS